MFVAIKTELCAVPEMIKPVLVIILSFSRLCVCSAQFYGLWKDPEGLNVMGGSDTTTLNGVTSPDTRQTIVQLNQEIQKLRQELSQVSPANTARLKILYWGQLDHAY